MVAVSEEVKRGQILCRHYFNQELVIYRGDDGVVRIARAFCPHMGAHLGRVGKLEGNILRCGFHGFRYDGEGRCVATPYGSPPPAGAKLRFWEAREQNGLILTWYGASAPPRQGKYLLPVLNGPLLPRWQLHKIFTGAALMKATLRMRTSWRPTPARLWKGFRAISEQIA